MEATHARAQTPQAEDNCLHCGLHFTRRTPEQKFCSGRCRAAYHRKRQQLTIEAKHVIEAAEHWYCQGGNFAETDKLRRAVEAMLRT